VAWLRRESTDGPENLRKLATAVDHTTSAATTRFSLHEALIGITRADEDPV
jgi:hypothetical protein